MKRTLRGSLVAMLALLPALLSADAASDLRVNQLEQDVRDLKRQIVALSRQLDELQRARPDRPVTPGSTETHAAAPNTEWVDASKWQKLHPGMSELEVITLLGPPSQT